jgi:hypothetical protein
MSSDQNKQCIARSGGSRHSPCVRYTCGISCSTTRGPFVESVRVQLPAMSSLCSQDACNTQHKWLCCSSKAWHCFLCPCRAHDTSLVHLYCCPAVQPPALPPWMASGIRTSPPSSSGVLAAPSSPASVSALVPSVPIPHLRPHLQTHSAH